MPHSNIAWLGYILQLYTKYIIGGVNMALRFPCQWTTGGKVKMVSLRGRPNQLPVGPQSNRSVHSPTAWSTDQQVGPQSNRSVHSPTAWSTDQQVGPQSNRSVHSPTAWSTDQQVGPQSNRSVHSPTAWSTDQQVGPQSNRSVHSPTAWSTDQQVGPQSNRSVYSPTAWSTDQQVVVLLWTSVSVPPLTQKKSALTMYPPPTSTLKRPGSPPWQKSKIVKYLPSVHVPVHWRCHGIERYWSGGGGGVACQEARGVQVNWPGKTIPPHYMFTVGQTTCIHW